MINSNSSNRPPRRIARLARKARPYLLLADFSDGEDVTGFKLAYSNVFGGSLKTFDAMEIISELARGDDLRKNREDFVNA